MDNQLLNILGICQGDARQWVDQLRNGDPKPNWLARVDHMLSNLSSSQLDILRSKFKGVEDRDRLIDKLIEMLVGEEFVSETPLFSKDSAAGPDIYLKATKRYIEVKHINHSDDEKVILDQLRSRPIMESSRIGASGSFAIQDEAEYQLLLKQGKATVDTAASQLNGYVGLIYLVYSLDFTPLTILPKAHIARRFEDDMNLYAESVGQAITVKSLQRLLGR